MEGSVSIGNQVNFKLRETIMVYETAKNGSETTFVTRNPVVLDSAGVAHVGAGTLISSDFLDSLLKELRGSAGAVLLPENVLVYTQERIVWWVPGAVRRMFYLTDRSPELEALSGKEYPQPALLFDVRSGSMTIFALKDTKRPTAESQLCQAPYWNLSDNGLVCLGSTRVPQALSIDTLKEWEASFFKSEFTHQNSGRPLTTHPNGFVGLWRELAGKKAFPVKYLAGDKATLGKHLAG